MNTPPAPGTPDPAPVLASVPETAARMRLGGGYWTWLTAAICSEFGSAVMAFAISWTATGYGGAVAGVVTAATMLFRTVLLLPGGAAGDRYGPRGVMIACDGAMLLLTAVGAVWFAVRGPSVAALVVVGCVLGIVSAFYMPASGVFSRLFVQDRHLARVMATTTSGLQIARITGPAVGGLLLAWIGLTRVIALNAATFLIVVVVVLLVVPPRAARPPDTAPVGLRDAWRGIRTGGHQHVLIPLLIAFGALVAGTSPAMMMLFPLLARDRGWSATDAGLIAGLCDGAALVVVLLVAARGTLPRAGVPLVGGPLVAGAGLLTVAAAPAVWVASIGAVGVGIGLVTFNVHAVPRFLAASPPHAQVRLQALLGLTATLPAFVLSSPYGLLAEHTSVAWALGATTVCTVLAAALMAATRPWSTNLNPAPPPAA